MAKRKTTVHKKRTLSQEQIAKMQAGKKLAAEKRKALAKFDNLEKRLSNKED